MVDLDVFDRNLLTVLQKEGRISTQDLAKAVNLSTSPCWRRIKKLEAAGVIDRYVALLQPKQLGLGAMAYVHVSLMDHREQTIQTFDEFVAFEDQILECCSITGTNDYVLKVVAKDPEDLEFFIMKKMLGLGIVRASTTNFVLRQKKYSTALPLET